ncbi:hypothetical protein EGJ15_11980 [Pseudomonas sp. p99-361]|nr:hypothetical protein EGJ15_11980 [Pseudomonas sp. p99-361]
MGAGVPAKGRKAAPNYLTDRHYLWVGAFFLRWSCLPSAPGGFRAPWASCLRPAADYRAGTCNMRYGSRLHRCHAVMVCIPIKPFRSRLPQSEAVGLS